MYLHPSSTSELVGQRQSDLRLCADARKYLRSSSSSPTASRHAGATRSRWRSTTLAIVSALAACASSGQSFAASTPNSGTPNSCIALNSGDYNACNVGNSGRGDLPYRQFGVQTPNSCIALNGGDYNACNVGNSGRGDLPYRRAGS